jgi:hypothetical protein
MSPQEARSEVSALPHVTFFGAVDETKAVQEFKIGNERTKRGALSYAFARMIAGADKPADGLVTRDHAYDYVFKTVSTLSNDRQTPVREPSPTTGDLSAYKSVVFRLVGEADAKPDPTPAPRGIRVAAADGDANAFASIGKPVSAYAVVSDPAEADLVWDRAGQRLLAGSDEILSGATANDIPGAIDRMAAVASLKKLAEQRSFSITLQDGGKKYSARDYRDRKYGPIPVATGVAGRELLVFNIAGDGKLQMLFPSAAARAAGRVNADPWQMSPSVTKPFGADLVVALSSAKRQDGLEPWLRANHDKAVAGLIGEKLAAAMAADPDLRIGIVGLYTGP